MQKQKTGMWNESLNDRQMLYGCCTLSVDGVGIGTELRFRKGTNQFLSKSWGKSYSDSPDVTKSDVVNKIAGIESEANSFCSCNRGSIAAGIDPTEFASQVTQDATNAYKGNGNFDPFTKSYGVCSVTVTNRDVANPSAYSMEVKRGGQSILKGIVDLGTNAFPGDKDGFTRYIKDSCL